MHRWHDTYLDDASVGVGVEDMLGPAEAITIIRDSLELYRKLRRGELR